MTKAVCFKKEKIKGKYRYHCLVLNEKGREVTRWGIESKTRLGKKQLIKRTKIRLKKIQKIFPNLSSPFKVEIAPCL